jgi:hypothetical protein
MFGDEILVRLGLIPDEGLLPLLFSLLVALLVYLIWLLILRLFPEHRAKVPERDRRPHGAPIREEETMREEPIWQPPIIEEPERMSQRTSQTTAPVRTDDAIVLVKQTLLIREPSGRLRFDTVVRPDDKGIRPFIQYAIPPNSPLVERKLTIRCKILGPRKRNPDWQIEEEVVFVPGVFDMWPQNEEFPIFGHYRQQGNWRLILEFVVPGRSRPWNTIEFRIAQEVNIVQDFLGDDATLTRSAVNEIAESLPKEMSMEDIFK